MLLLGDGQEHYILSHCWPIPHPLHIKGGRWKQLSVDGACTLTSAGSLERLFCKLGSVLSRWSLHRQGGELVKLLLAPLHFLEGLHRMFTPRWLRKYYINTDLQIYGRSVSSTSRHAFIRASSKHARGSVDLQHFREKCIKTIRSGSECTELSLEYLELRLDMCMFRDIGMLILTNMPL